MFAVIRLRGSASTNKNIEHSLGMFRLKAPNNCVVVPDTPSYRGMMQQLKDYVTYGEISLETLARLLEKRGRLAGDKRLDGKTVKETGYDKIESLAKDLLEKGVALKDVRGIKPVFRLTPPAHGFKSVKLAYPKGDLGYRGEKINELIERMI